MPVLVIDENTPSSTKFVTEVSSRDPSIIEKEEGIETLENSTLIIDGEDQTESIPTAPPILSDFVNALFNELANLSEEDSTTDDNVIKEGNLDEDAEGNTITTEAPNLSEFVNALFNELKNLPNNTFAQFDNKLLEEELIVAEVLEDKIKQAIDENNVSEDTVEVPKAKPTSTTEMSVSLNVFSDVLFAELKNFTTSNEDSNVTATFESKKLEEKDEEVQLGSTQMSVKLNVFSDSLFAELKNFTTREKDREGTTDASFIIKKLESGNEEEGLNPDIRIINDTERGIKSALLTLNTSHTSESISEPPLNFSRALFQELSKLDKFDTEQLLDESEIKLLLNESSVTNANFSSILFQELEKLLKNQTSTGNREELLFEIKRLEDSFQRIKSLEDQEGENENVNFSDALFAELLKTTTSNQSLESQSANFKTESLNKEDAVQVQQLDSPLPDVNVNQTSPEFEQNNRNSVELRETPALSIFFETLLKQLSRNDTLDSEVTVGPSISD